MLGLDKLFIVSAIAGGALFAVQLVLLFIGGGGGDTDLDLDLDGDATHHDAGNASFKVLSLQGITAFVMMFGLVGWAMREDSEAQPLISLGAAIAAGGLSTYLISRLFHFFNRLQSSGNLDMKTAVGAIGQVYLTVGPGKPGKVNITVGSRSLTLEGITDGSETLETGTPVRVTRVISDICVSVERH